MAIGASPIIPLHRVLADPEARFQRFGLNDSQLFGKPLVNLASPSKRTVAQEARPEETLKKTRGLEAEPSAQGALAPELAPTYSGQAETQTGLASVPKAGSYVNLKA